MVASWLKDPAGMWIDPLQARARGTRHRLISLWIVGNSWIIGPTLRLLASVGTLIDEKGHDARLTWLSASTPDLVQGSFGRFLFVRTVRAQ